jgi:hypothetical protein
VLLLSTSAASFRNGTDLTPEQPAVVSFCEVLIAREGQRWNRPRLFPSLFKLHRSDTPTRATARARKEPTGSTPKLAHVRQPRTMVVNPG